VAAAAIVTPPRSTRVIAARRSFKGAFEDLIADVSPGDRLYGYSVAEAEGGAIAFHHGSTFPEIETLAELDEVLRNDPRAVVYIPEVEYDELLSSGELPADTAVVARRPYRHHTALLIRRIPRREIRR
jgi:hypothetical protein